MAPSRPGSRSYSSDGQSASSTRKRSQIRVLLGPLGSSSNWLERDADNIEVEGSNPFYPTIYKERYATSQTTAGHHLGGVAKR